MRVSAPRSLTVIATLAVFLLPLTAGTARAADGPWWRSTADADREATARILGGDLAGWTLQNQRLQPAVYAIEQVGDTPVMVPDAAGLRLLGNTRYGPGTEIIVRYRFAPVGNATAIFKLSTGIKDPADAKDMQVWFSCSARGGGDTIALNAFDPSREGERVNYATGSFRLDGIGDRSLGWPERLRKTAEHEAAQLSGLDETWITTRVRLLDKGFDVFVNDRLMVERRNVDIDVSGYIRIELWRYAELASVTVRPVEAGDPRYEPIRIGGYLNAWALNGAPLERASLPPAETPALVGGRPFVFPQPDAEGRDHIDLGPSWMQAAYLAGHMYPQLGPFSGRWPSPFVMNPARIRFQVPRRRYRALHVIAAADNDRDSVPVITAQFYRPTAGRPVNFAGRVPLFTAESADAEPLPVRLENGREGRLYLVTIPIEPGALDVFDDMDTLAVELTKAVKLYRGYPDPSFYSFHAAGRPSSVHVYAMTFEAPAVTLTMTPDAYGHIWTAPQSPTYTVALHNVSQEARKVRLDLTTVSYDGSEKTEQTQEVSVPAGGKGTTVKLTVAPKRFGYHDVRLTLTDGAQVWNETTTLAYLHADTRDRSAWKAGQGPYFGFWTWGGGHLTPSHEKATLVSALSGGMGQGGSYATASDEVKAIAAKYGMATLKHFGASDHWVTGAFRTDLQTMPEAEAVAKLVEGLRKIVSEPTPITQTHYVSFFPEPHIGHITTGALPEYFGEPPYELTEAEEERFQTYLKALLVGAPAVKKEWPNAKIMLPHGDPMFTAIFARRSEEARKWIDGLAVDIPVFERVPEQQVHQVSLHRLWMCREEFREAGLTNMVFPMFEGPCLPTRPGALTQKQGADHLVRCALILNAYGIDQFCGSWGMFESGDYWGEQHYGGGVMHPIPLECPKPMYAAHATMTRHLNRKNFEKWLPTGSLSVYAVQYRHYKTGELTHLVWTIRGTRPVTVRVEAGAKVRVFDIMDNASELLAQDGKVTFPVEQGPVFVEGLGADPAIVPGAPDHSDSAPAAESLRLANLGSGSWQQSEEEEVAYANNNFLQVRRFPGKMSVRQEAAPEAQGGKALAVHLGEQDTERLIMPYYTSLVPRRPVAIPGKASHLGLWVRASSDWGRVVYVLRDDEGERWISIGTKNEWNCDDIHNWSFFNFDGWRYLRFELPANSPYDTFREYGSTWWGASEGDGIVDLPLRLEKIIVERRTHAMYVNDPQPASKDDVLLGDLYAEYAAPEDRGKEAVALSRMRMPVPSGIPELDNPIAKLAADGVGEPLNVMKITLPEQQADGTQCYVHFETVADAKGYDIWAAPYEDGKGALKLGTGWAEPGKLVRGLRPDLDFYLFLVYTDKDGKPSQPSPPFKVHLKDIFGMK